MPARDCRIAKLAKENKKLAVSNHSLTSYFPSAPKKRYICIFFFHDVRRQKSFGVLLSMLLFFLLQSDVMKYVFIFKRSERRFRVGNAVYCFL